VNPARTHTAKREKSRQKREKMTWLIKIEVQTQEDANYILEHLNTQNPVIDTELEELSDE